MNDATSTTPVDSTAAEAVEPSANPISADAQDSFQAVADELRADIIHLLGTYPYVSKYMLQVGLGPSTSPKLWHPILDQLISDKLVVEQQEQVTTPKGRNRVRTVLHLSRFPYPPVATAPTV